MSKPGDFIVLCHPRSGSNLVLWGLDRHEDVQMAGEVFDGTHDRRGAGLPEAVEPYRQGMSGRDFLMRHIFPPLPGPPIVARGFKLFYEHARADPPAKTLWPQLIGERRIRVIQLIRPNLFDCLVSLEVAYRTGEWFRLMEMEAMPRTVPPFSISPYAAREYFGKITSWQTWAASAFAHHPTLTIDYHALCADFGGTMAQIFEFIGVAPMIMEPALQRQAKIPPAQQIINYEELRREFRHSLFESFFADDRAAG